MKFQDWFKLGMDRQLADIKDFLPGKVLNLGAGNKLIAFSIPLDLPAWDADKDPIPMPDRSVAGIHAYHFLEHVKNPIAVLQEMQRVLMVGGLVNIVVPYYNSQMQAHDLDHKAVFCEDTWKILFETPYYDKYRGNFIWKFKIVFNLIVGIVERNLALFTQLEKID